MSDKRLEELAGKLQDAVATREALRARMEYDEETAKKWRDTADVSRMTYVNSRVVADAEYELLDYVGAKARKKADD